MAALALITLANVLARYFTNNSIAWTEEISVFLMIALALVAGSAAVARDRHIRIEYFAESGSGTRRRFLARFGALMVALLFGTIAVLSVRVVWDDYRFEETSPGIGVPQWWYSVWLPIFSALITVRAIGLFIRRGKQPDVEFLRASAMIATLLFAAFLLMMLVGVPHWCCLGAGRCCHCCGQSRQPVVWPAGRA